MEYVVEKNKRRSKKDKNKRNKKFPYKSGGTNRIKNKKMDKENKQK